MKTKYENVSAGQVFEIDGERWLKIQGEVFRDTQFYPVIAGPFDAISQNGVCGTFDWLTEVELVGDLQNLPCS